jgi:hypothetical protein
MTVTVTHIPPFLLGSLPDTVTYITPHLICDILPPPSSHHDLNRIDAWCTKRDMTLRGVLSESQKVNISSVNVAPLGSLAGVKQAIPMSGNTKSMRLVDEAILEVDLTDAADPLMSSGYLSTPLNTILESMHDPYSQYISFHDLIEAYSVLSARIRAQLRVIINANQPVPALEPLKEHAFLFARALGRDIRRALIDPSNGLRITHPSGESSITSVSMTDHEIQYGGDLAILCHHALRFLSDIFAFKALYMLFTGMHSIESSHCRRFMLLIQNKIFKTSSMTS